MKKNILILLSILFLKCSSNTQSDYTSLNEELETISMNSSIKGFGVSVFSKNKVHYSKGFGVSSHERNKRYTIKSRQKIASISKLLLGVSILKAQELKLLNLDDNVNDYLPFPLTNPNFPNDIITIRHLATHTSGLSKNPEYDLKALYLSTKIPIIIDEMPSGTKKEVLNQTIELINSNKYYTLKDYLTNLYDPNGKWYSEKYYMKVKPGVKTEYSNSGASLLALVIEKASGISYADFVEKYISTPLQLENSKFDFEKHHTESLPTQYHHAGINIPSDYNLLLYPAGGYESTVEDFTKFMSTILSDNSILSKESIKEMLSSEFINEYGIFWEIYSNGYVGHTGDILGVTTLTYYNIEKDIGYLLFCNTAGTEDIEKEIEKIRNTFKSHFKEFADEHE